MEKLSPETAAQKVLANCAWNGELPVDAAKIAAFYDVKIVEDQLLVGGPICGRIFRHEKGMLILLNPAEDFIRKNYTIAHELGHAFLHGVGQRESTVANFSVEQYRDEEREANGFAQALLMPEKVVSKYISLGKSVDELTAIFAVTQTVMRMRLERLWFIN